MNQLINLIGNHVQTLVRTNDIGKGFQFISWLSATLIALILIASGFVRHLWVAKTAP
jgi:hypothetical protein